MGLGSKILFIEDATEMDEQIINILEKADLIEGDILDRNALNESSHGNIVIATSFEDAFDRIISLGDGFEYEWIFIDRNLGEYNIFSGDGSISTLADFITNTEESWNDFSIGSKVFKKEFFKGVSGTNNQSIFVGDYLFITLINAGVPIEKICFLTANNDNSIEELEKSPFLHKKRLPQIIGKGSDGWEEELETILRDSHCAKIRFLYQKIFNNKKVNEIFDPYISDFITILAKQLKYGMEKRFEKGDGIVLRNMIEALVAHISKTNEQSVRNYLNLSEAYSALFKREYTPRNFECFKRSSYYQTGITREKVKKFLQAWKDGKDIRFDVEAETERVLQYATALELGTLANFYKGKTCPSDPPKYIFSYIDNIYTVTSEFSAHGKNDRTTDDLSIDGWKALLSAMIQILQWVADTNPNTKP